MKRIRRDRAVSGLCISKNEDPGVPILSPLIRFLTFMLSTSAFHKSDEDPLFPEKRTLCTLKAYCQREQKYI
jgi:hypothetical protein